jgi:hypothetical protein
LARADASFVPTLNAHARDAEITGWRNALRRIRSPF